MKITKIQSTATQAPARIASAQRGHRPSLGRSGKPLRESRSPAMLNRNTPFGAQGLPALGGADGR